MSTVPARPAEGTMTSAFDTFCDDRLQMLFSELSGLTVVV